MTASLVVNIILFAALLAAAIYGGLSLSKGRLGIYYLDAFLAVCSMMIGRLFIVVDTAANGDTSGFSLGSLGIVCSFFFLIGANIYILKKKTYTISAWKRAVAIIVPLLMMAILVCVCVFGQITFNYMVPSILLFVSAVPGMYLSLTVALADKPEGSCLKGLGAFNVIVTIIGALSVLDEAVWLFDEHVSTDIYQLVLIVAAVVCCLIMMPVLRRGMK